MTFHSKILSSYHRPISPDTVNGSGFLGEKNIYMEEKGMQLTVNSNLLTTARNIDSISLQVRRINPKNGFELALYKAEALTQIKQMINGEFLEKIKSLAGTKLGYRADKDNYSDEVYRDCFIEATLLGLQVTGNHFNIISASCYTTKEGFTYLLNNIEGLWHDVTLNVPETNNGITTIVAACIWQTKDMQKKESRELKFPVRVTKDASIDNLLGKAERKAKRWLYNYITGLAISDGDANDNLPMMDAEIVDDKKPEETSQENNEKENKKQEEAPEVDVLDENENRGYEYLKKATDKEDLDKRWIAVKTQIPTFKDKYYHEVYAIITKQ